MEPKTKVIAALVGVAATVISATLVYLKKRKAALKPKLNPSDQLIIDLIDTKNKGDKQALVEVYAEEYEKSLHSEPSSFKKCVGLITSKLPKINLGGFNQQEAAPVMATSQPQEVATG